MIKVRATVRDGLYLLQMDGHANPQICAAASAIFQAAALGLRDLSDYAPREIAFDTAIDFQGSNKLDSKARKR